MFFIVNTSIVLPLEVILVFVKTFSHFNSFSFVIIVAVGELSPYSSCLLLFRLEVRVEVVYTFVPNTNSPVSVSIVVSVVVGVVVGEIVCASSLPLSIPYVSAVIGFVVIVVASDVVGEILSALLEVIFSLSDHSILQFYIS